MNFEDLQESWQAQPVNVITDLDKLYEQKSRWQIRQRKILRTNICTSLAFLATIVGLTWVYISHNHEFGWAFKVSIVSLCLLMFIFSGVVWKGYAFKKENLEVSSDRFINYQIRKLNWQRNTITTYIWIYNTLIWLSLVMYTFEATRRGSITFRVTALVIITLYIFGVTWWFKVKKHTKQLLDIDSLISDLENIKDRLMENENNGYS